MRLLLFIASLVAPSLAYADDSGYAEFLREELVLENRFENGVMHVNGREFLMGDLHEWPKASHDFRAYFMVRSSIWLREFLDNDPVLKYQDFDIFRTSDSTFTGDRYLAHQMELAPSPPRDCEYCYYELSLDPVLQVAGYNTYSSGGRSLLFLPKGSVIAHGFRCYRKGDGAPFTELSSCSVTVVYPYATNIVLNGRRIWPGTVAEYGPSFAAIAERMLEIVTCIDITDEPTAGNTLSFSDLLASHPNLTGCTIDLTG